MLDFLANNISTILAVFSVIVALVAAFFAYLAVRATRSMGEAALVVQFLNEYQSTEMSDSLLLLVHWKNTFENEFVTKYLEQKTKRSKLAERVNEARRKVLHYHIKARELRHYHLVSKEFVKAVVRAGLGVQYYIVEPLEKGIYELSKDVGTAADLKRMLNLKEYPEISNKDKLSESELSELCL